MITLTEFINKWNGKYLTVLSPGKQCFDLVVAQTNNLGVPHFPNNPSPFPYANAYQIYTDFGAFQSQYFTRIANPPVGGPLGGDIVVWSYPYNYAGGHTGVATGKGASTGASSDWFECFEQNDPRNKPCQLRNYNFSNVLGWLRPKYYTTLTKEQQMLAIINTPISDPDFRNKVRAIYGV